MQVRIPVTIPEDGYYNFIADHVDVEMTIEPCLVEPALQPIAPVNE